METVNQESGGFNHLQMEVQLYLRWRFCQPDIVRWPFEEVKCSWPFNGGFGGLADFYRRKWDFVDPLPKV